MTIYRNDYRSSSYASCGFSFHSTERESKTEADMRKENTKNNTGDEKIEEVETVEITFSSTKLAIVTLLNRYASHNDNG